jgi:hypothetical protein
MKNLFLSLVLVMVGLVANSQVVTVTITKFQNFNHSSSIPTFEAMKSDLIEYPNYGIGKNVYTFDFNKRTVNLVNCNGNFTSPIVEVFNTGNTFDCIVDDNGVRTYFTLGLIEGEDTLEFITEYEKDNRVFGSFSKGSDVSFNIK